ncbi:ABC transporter permease [Candidatus Sumerlaeota bacterium]|nr:ABC transporter permease [Candidatus Sumerlaeota bacterium]
MLFILILLCIFFSIMTLSTQHPEGEKAGRILFSELKARDQNSSILIVSKPSREDEAFSDTLSKLLKEAGYQSLEIVKGDPASVKLSLEKLAHDNTHIDLIATTSNYAPAVSRIRENLPSLSNIAVLTPKSSKWPTFLLTDNLMNVANQIVVIAIIAVGMTMVIITAGIDLSVGSLIALSAVIVTWLIGKMGGAGASHFNMLVCSLAAIMLCGCIGAFSGFMITRFRIPPFIATLGMMQVASGFAYIISRGKPIYDVPDTFVWLGRGKSPILSLPWAVLLMIVIYAIAHIIMTRATLGRHIYAVGGNPEAARLSGVRVNRILLFVYITCGAMAGLGGIVTSSQLKSGAPTYGLMYELYVIASVVVGGTSLSGGEGKILGTLIGAFIIAVIQNGMNLTNVESYTQKVVLGFVILGAVLLDMLKKRGWRRRKKTT